MLPALPSWREHGRSPSTGCWAAGEALPDRPTAAPRPSLRTDLGPGLWNRPLGKPAADRSARGIGPTLSFPGVLSTRVENPPCPRPSVSQWPLVWSSPTIKETHGKTARFPLDVVLCRRLPRAPPPLGTCRHSPPPGQEQAQPLPGPVGLTQTHPRAPPAARHPSCPHLCHLSLKPSPAWSAPLQSPQVSRLQPCGLTTATAQPKSLFWGDNTRVPSGSLPLVPKDLSSTLARGVLLDTSQLWSQPRGELRCLSLCLDATSGSLLWPRFWVCPAQCFLIAHCPQASPAGVPWNGERSLPPPPPAV